MSRRFNLVDGTLLIYLGLLTLHLLATAPKFTEWKIQIGINILILAGITVIARINRNSRHPAVDFIHLFYPVLLLMWLYPQACMLRFTVLPEDLDPIIIGWDRAVFRGDLYIIIAKKLNLFWMEMVHGVYFVYYISLGLFGMLAYQRQRRLVETYLFTLILCMCLHQWSVIIFPSAGPMHLRAELIPKGVFFIPIMDFIYSNIDKGGGAFPSLHSAAVVVVCAFAAKMFSQWKWPIYFFMFAVLFSTFATVYHYPIDTAVGFTTGIICVIFLPKLFEYIRNYVDT